MDPTSILIIGAGELGGAVIANLAKHPARSNVKLAVLLRPSRISSNDTSKQHELQHFESIGIEIVEGDVVAESIDDLATTLGKFHTVINCSGMYLPPGTQTRVVKAALASGCRRYFPWQFGVDYDVIGPNSSQDLFTEQLDVRALLRSQSKMDWVILSTGMFISFLFEPAFDIVNAGRDTVTAIGSWENSITVTSPEDIGKITAELALACPAINGVVFAAGDTVSMQQIVDVVDNVLARNVKRQLKTVTQLKQELAADPGNGMRKYRVVFAEGVGVSWAKERSFNVKRAISTQTVHQWYVTVITIASGLFLTSDSLGRLSICNIEDRPTASSSSHRIIHQNSSGVVADGYDHRD